MYRNNHVNITIGRRGCGKTTYLLNKIIIPQSKKKKVLIIDTAYNDKYNSITRISPEKLYAWKKGVVYITGSDALKALDFISDLYNALIIFEDSTRYIRWNIPDNIRTLILDSKQKNLDLIFVYHGLNFVQPEMYKLADSLTIMKCGKIDGYADKIENFEAVKIVHENVQKNKDLYYYEHVKLY